MASKASLLERMRSNPKGDWRIADVEKLAKQHGMTFREPYKSSHAKVSSSYLTGILTIPFKRPIKARYISLLVSYTDAHLAEMARREGADSG